MRKLLLLLLLSVLFTSSCTKESESNTDAVRPKMEIIYPLDKPSIFTSDPLCMKVLISDNKSLMNVWLVISDRHGFKKDYPISGRSMEIIEKYIAPAGVRGNLTAKFFALDEAGNLNSAEINFSVEN